MGGNTACFRASTHRFLAPYNLLRFELIVLTLPWVLLSIFVRAVLDYAQPSWGGLVPDYALSTFTFAFFLFLGMMFQGVLSDFQEAQKLPGAVAVQLDSLFERAAFLGRLSQRGGGCGLRLPALQRELLEYTLCLFEYLAELRGHMDALALTGALASTFAEASSDLPGGADGDVWKVWEGTEALRALLVRLVVIKRTDFMAGGHVLMQLLTAFVVSQFTVASYVATGNAFGGETGTEDTNMQATKYVSIAGWNALFLYFLFLYEQLEDPFEFDRELAAATRSGTPHASAPPHTHLTRSTQP